MFLYKRKSNKTMGRKCILSKSLRHWKLVMAFSITFATSEILAFVSPSQLPRKIVGSELYAGNFFDKMFNHAFNANNKNFQTKASQVKKSTKQISKVFEEADAALEDADAALAGANAAIRDADAALAKTKQNTQLSTDISEENKRLSQKVEPTEERNVPSEQELERAKAEVERAKVMLDRDVLSELDKDLLQAQMESSEITFTNLKKELKARGLEVPTEPAAKVEPALATKETGMAPAFVSKENPSKEPTKKSQQKAPVEAKKKSNDGFDKIVKKTFPGAISNDELLTKVVGILESKGYTGKNTLLTTSLCCDELARTLEDDFYNVYGKNFNLGGLAGFPFGGTTAFGAMAAHIPDNGNTLVVFGPHVGITQDGLVGKVERKGIKLVDTCCGSAIAASNYLQGISDGNTPVNTRIKNFADFQQNAVKELILPHGERLMNAKNRMVELPYALFESQTMLLSDIVKEKSGGLKEGTAILGGIQINTGPDSPDYFHPLRFDYIDGNENVIEDLLPLIGVKKPTPRGWSKLTVMDLKKELNARGLPVSGKKVDLVARLEAAHSDSKEQEPQKEQETPQESAGINYQTLTVANLKEECKKHGLKTTGKKADLVARLAVLTKQPKKEVVASTSSNGDYNTMSVVELKNELRSKGLKMSGKKAELIDRLQTA